MKGLELDGLGHAKTDEAASIPPGNREPPKKLIQRGSSFRRAGTKFGKSSTTNNGNGKFGRGRRLYLLIPGPPRMDEERPGVSCADNKRRYWPNVDNFINTREIPTSDSLFPSILTLLRDNVALRGPGVLSRDIYFTLFM